MEACEQAYAETIDRIADSPDFDKGAAKKYLDGALGKWTPGDAVPKFMQTAIDKICNLETIGDNWSQDQRDKAAKIQKLPANTAIMNYIKKTLIKAGLDSSNAAVEKARQLVCTRVDDQYGPGTCHKAAREYIYGNPWSFGDGNGDDIPKPLKLKLAQLITNGEL